MTTVHVHPPDLEGDTLRILQLQAKDLAEKKRHREIFALDSFVAFVKSWGNDANDTIYWTTERVVAVLNEEDLKSGQGDQDTVHFAFTRPNVAERWLSALGRRFNHKDFKEFLELRFNEIAGGAGFFARIANLSLAQTFDYNAKLDTDQTFSVAFKSDAGPDVAQLPKVVEVTIPLINGLEKPFTLKLRLRLKAPTQAGESPAFWFEWDDREDVLEEAAKAAAAAIAEGLPGWLVVHGEPNIDGQDF